MSRMGGYAGDRVHSPLNQKSHPTGNLPATCYMVPLRNYSRPRFLTTVCQPPFPPERGARRKGVRGRVGRQGGRVRRKGGRGRAGGVGCAWASVGWLATGRCPTVWRWRPPPRTPPAVSAMRRPWRVAWRWPRPPLPVACVASCARCRIFQFGA